MKKPIILLLILVVILVALAVRATPFYQYFYNPDGTPQTNSFSMTAYGSENAWVVVGTNIYYGAQTVTFTPATNGYVSNAIAPNTYTVLFSNLNSGFYVTIPNTTNVTTLASYATSTPTISGTAFDSYGMVTNWLRYAPATNRPATNTIVYVSAVSGITNASGAVTNLSVTLTTNTIYYHQR
jgi:hypothetical protein